MARQTRKSVLRPEPRRTSCSSKTTMPPTADPEPQRQPAHVDADFALPTYLLAFVVNVPTIGSTPENGCIKTRLGTHIDQSYCIACPQIFSLASMQASVAGKTASRANVLYVSQYCLFYHTPWKNAARPTRHSNRHSLKAVAKPFRPWNRMPRLDRS